MTRSKQHSHQVTVPLLLEYIGGVQWHIIASYDTAQKAAVSYLLRLVNGGSGPVKTASAGYAAEGGKIGQVINKALKKKHGSSATPPWSGLPAALAGCPNLSVTRSVGGGYTKVQLDIARLIRDAAASRAGQISSTVCTQPSSSTATHNVSSTAVQQAEGDASWGQAAASSLATAAETAWHHCSSYQSSVRVVPRPAGPQQTQPVAVAAAAAAGTSTLSTTPPQQQDPVASSLPLQSLQLLPMPQCLEILSSVSQQQCADATVVLVPQDMDFSLGCDPLLQLVAHLRAARLCALDLEFAQATPQQLQRLPQQSQQQQAEPSTTARQGASNSSSSTSCHGPRVDVLALMQLFVPRVVDSDIAAYPAMIYVVEVPQQQSAASGLLQCVRDVLEEPGVVKVMHDARCDSSVLQRQFGITLAGVLDTQVLAGMAALAAAVPSNNGSSSSSSSGGGQGVLFGASGTAAGSSSQAASSSGHNNSSSSSGWSDLGRIGLGKLYEAYGCRHPKKSTVGKSFDDNPRLWFSRPLPPEALQYAADDVRYLLLIAHSLLQTLPALTMQLSSINMQLGQSTDLPLQVGLIPGYAPLMHRSGGNAMHDDVINSSGTAGQELLQQPGLTDTCFELKLDQSISGWYLASYQLYLNEQAGQDGGGGNEPATTAAAAAASLVGAEGNTAYLSVPDRAPAGPEEDCTDSSGASSSSSSSSSKSSRSSSTQPHQTRQGVFARFSSLLQARASAAPPRDAEAAETLAEAAAELSPAAQAVTVSEDDNSATSQPEVDKAVYSTMQLLPHKLHPFLQPYLDRACGRSLIEAVLYNKRNVELRFADSDSVFLEARSSIPQALELLAAAKEQWQQQNDESDEGVCDDATPQQPALPNGNMQHTNSFQSSYSSLNPAKPAANGATVARAWSSSSHGPAGDMFRSDERLGVPSTLHRIAAMRNLNNEVIGLTYRIGRHVPGVAMMLGDLLSAMKASLQSNKPLSLLILGRPGVGKTTLLRDIARLLSLTPEERGLGRKVIIVDTSNEIAGDADEMHPCVGRALRMMVPRREHQAKLLVQAVQNHNPQVLIVDEIGTKEEVEAAKTMAPRGALLIGTAHGHSLSDLLRNHVLNPLVGGVREVTLGDAEAKASNAGQKTRYERASAAPFVALLELKSRDSWRLHMNVERSVDARFAGRSNSGSDSSSSQDITSNRRHQAPGPTEDTQLRTRDASGRLVVKFETAGAARDALKAAAMVRAAVQQQQQQQRGCSGQAPSDLDSDEVDDHEQVTSYAAVAGGGRGGFKGGLLTCSMLVTTGPSRLLLA